MSYTRHTKPVNAAHAEQDVEVVVWLDVSTGVDVRRVKPADRPAIAYPNEGRAPGTDLSQAVHATVDGGALSHDDVSTPMMRAAVVERAGGPEVLEVRSIQRPRARPGWVLVEVRAFGLNRSELFTRQGLSPSVKFPRTVYKSEVVNAEHSTAMLQRIVDDVERGVYNANLDRVFPLERIAEAHRYMESNAATGKVVGIP